MSVTIHEPQPESPAPVPVPCETRPGSLDEETRKVLQDARRKVIGGWFRNGTSPYREGSGPHCVLTAIYTSRSPEAACNATRVIELALGVEYPSDIAEWNNDASRTKAEVIALFDRVLAA